jgi:hypothetical protein
LLLDKTNELLEGIGKAVQRQKDVEHVSQPEGSEVPKGSGDEGVRALSLLQGSLSSEVVGAEANRRTPSSRPLPTVLFLSLFNETS